MNRTGLLLAASAIAALLQASPVDTALAQGGSPSANANAPTQQLDTSASDEPSVETVPTTDLPILYVTAVEVIRTATEPRIDIVRATGLAASKGWSFPQLVPTSARTPRTAYLTSSLLGRSRTSHRKPKACVPVSAVLELAPGDPFKGVRVHGSANAIQVKSMPGISVATINVDDCHDSPANNFRGRSRGGGSAGYRPPGGSAEAIAGDHPVERHRGSDDQSESPQPFAWRE